MARDQRWSCSAFVSGIRPNRLPFTVSVMVANLDAPLCQIPPAALLVRHLVPPTNENHGSEIHCAALDGGPPRDGHGRHRAKLPNPGGTSPAVSGANCCCSCLFIRGSLRI